MTDKTIQTDICVIGAGSGGLSVAAGASQMGANVVLVEKAEMGGDCLNTGCVPSKALLAAADIAAQSRIADQFGVQLPEPETDWQAVHGHVHSVIAAIEPNDSQERFESFGVQVIRETGSFTDHKTVQAGNYTVQARYFVVATGSSAFVPPLDGLQDVSYFTNESIFDNADKIEHLIVIGGGPIGMEMAQAHRRLGARVTVIARGKILPKDDPELTRVVIRQMRKEGIQMVELASNVRFTRESENIITVHFETSEGKQNITASHTLIATGRKANIDQLNLDAAGVQYSPRGIETDARLRSTNKRIFAIGDVTGPYQFTHMAAYQAGIVIRNILFKLPAKVSYKAVPWVTYTDPELAHVGMAQADAENQGMETRVITWPFEENDRAQAEKHTHGMVKVVLNKKGLILGASLVGRHAGDLLQPWILAMNKGMKIGDMANIIAPYPTLSEVNKRVAGSYYTPVLFGERTKKIVRLLMRFS